MKTKLAMSFLNLESIQNEFRVSRQCSPGFYETISGMSKIAAKFKCFYAYSKTQLFRDTKYMPRYFLEVVE